jgi:hypothetical protein
MRRHVRAKGDEEGSTMTMTPGFERFLVGLLCGAIFGAAGFFSRQILGLIFGLAAAAILFLIVDQGVPGLEITIGHVLGEVQRYQHFVLGAAVGVLLASSVLRGGSRASGGER